MHRRGGSGEGQLGSGPSPTAPQLRRQKLPGSQVLISLPTKWPRPPCVVVRTEVTQGITWRVTPQPNCCVPSSATAVILRRAGAHAPLRPPYPRLALELGIWERKVGSGTENEGWPALSCPTGRSQPWRPLQLCVS